jgi:TPR repeat protein
MEGSRDVTTRIAACIAVIVLAVVLPLSRADVETGMVAYDAGDYETAYQAWLPLAEQGSPAAQFNLSLLYRYGKGRPVDSETAAEWCLKAADAGFVPAQYEMAKIYEAGEGVRRNPVEAHKFYSLAASQRYEDAKKRKKQLAKTMTSTQLAHAEMWLREWKKARKAESQD